MDFTALQQGVVMALTTIASATFSISPVAPPSEVSLSHPEIISSYDLPQGTSEPESIQNLNVITQPVTDQLQMIVKEVRADEIATVEQPPIVYTVIEPTPKPSSKPSEEPKKSEESQEAKKAEDKKEEAKPSPSAEPSEAPKPSEAPALTGSNADILFQMTNDYRSKIGKPAFQKEERLCKIAEQRAPQVNGELSSGNLHKGFRELNLPYWATENIAAYATMKENFQFLSTDYIHKKAIESDAKYSCTACSGTSCSQVFSSFIPKHSD